MNPYYLDAIKKSEGYTPRAAWDYKQHSVGYGTRARHPGEVIDREEAERRFAEEIGKARSIVESVAPNADEGTKAALTSLTYNAGDAWTRSGLGEAIRAGDLPRAKGLFLQYVNAGGAPNEGLIARRQREAAWFGGDTSQPKAAEAPQPTPQPAPETPPVANSEAPKSIPELVAGLFDGEPAKKPQQQAAQQSMLMQPDEAMAVADLQAPRVRKVDLGRLRAALQSRMMRA